MNIYKQLFLTAAFAIATSTALAEKINLSGSDLIKPYIADTLQSTSKKNDIQLNIKMEGTYSAYDDLKSGKADIAIVALPRSQKLPEGLVAIPFAYQAAIIIVNSVNPIEEITTKQLYDIYSISTKTRSETWEQVGVKNIGLRNVMAITTSLADNVVVELFKYTAINGMNIGQWVHIAENKAAIYNLIKANNSAIAVIGKPSKSDTNLVKVLSVAKTDEHGQKTYAFKPDKDNIANGDYALSLPFYIVFEKNNVNKVKNFTKILLSDDIANKIDSSDFFSAPKNSRKKSIFDLDIPM